MPSQIAGVQRDDGLLWGQGRAWRDPALYGLSMAIFGDLPVFAPDPNQWELELGDVLPLQPGRNRSERSERGPLRAGASDA